MELVSNVNKVLQ